MSKLPSSTKKICRLAPVARARLDDLGDLVELLADVVVRESAKSGATVELVLARIGFTVADRCSAWLPMAFAAVTKVLVEPFGQQLLNGRKPRVGSRAAADSPTARTSRTPEW